MKECYKCEYCGQIYDTEVEAGECESKHAKGFKVVDADYMRKAVLPTSITVEADDGTTKTYYNRGNMNDYVSEGLNGVKNADFGNKIAEIADHYGFDSQAFSKACGSRAEPSSGFLRVKPFNARYKSPDTA